MNVQGAMLKAAQQYKFQFCAKSSEHLAYQLNQTCIEDACGYQFEPLCTLCSDKKVLGKKQRHLLGSGLLRSSLVLCGLSLPAEPRIGLSLFFGGGYPSHLL